MVKAVLCKEYGMPDDLVIEEIEPLQPDDNEVVVAVKACSVNFPDTLIIQGKYQYKPPLPFSPGCEVSGTVARVGAAITAFKPGDRVIGSPGWGGFAEEAIVPAHKLIAMPDEIDYRTGASLVLTYGTSHHALIDRGQLAAGETLVVLGAAGGVGLAAIEIGKVLGARVIAAASTDEKLTVCREHGADETINYSNENLKDRIKELTGGNGADVVYDPVGGDYSEQALRATAWRGRFLVIGFAAGGIPKLPANLALLKGCSIVGVFWGQFTTREPEQNQKDLNELLQWVKEGKLRPHIDHVYQLEQTSDALKQMMNRQVRGKVVVDI